MVQERSPLVPGREKLLLRDFRAPQDVVLPPLAVLRAQVVLELVLKVHVGNDVGYFLQLETVDLALLDGLWTHRGPPAPEEDVPVHDVDLVADDVQTRDQRAVVLDHRPRERGEPQVLCVLLLKALDIREVLQQELDPQPYRGERVVFPCEGLFFLELPHALRDLALIRLVGFKLSLYSLKNASADALLVELDRPDRVSREVDHRVVGYRLF